MTLFSLSRLRERRPKAERVALGEGKHCVT
ncbi:MAG: hypothetical protein OJF55_000907 [Rhodanobacteraceae bacterium]|jgi:hypothetical protein|nr:MAG: hypothetical protein OJF55_000907 [Rhodanobacteraceae bacterium]